MDRTLIAQSENDFLKARNKALFNELQHFLNPEESKLLSFSDVKDLLKPKGEVYMGMQVVPVSLIVGSEGRYHDFDNHFFPKSMHLKTRWESIDRAHLTDVILPPIILYEIGGLYFVRDGNHRVSVAKAQGVENIDAEVISLKSEIKLKPGWSERRILKQVIQYEKRVFYSETSFGDITDCWNIDFSTPGQYDVLYQHILIHKYYINQDKKDEIPMEEAILSWYNNLYLPIVTAIKKRKILRRFRGRTAADLYVWIIKYWDDLKKRFGQAVTIDDAASEFSEKFGKGIFIRIINFLSGLFKK
ncbi:MAG: transcriptional regulator [Treponemataceae bacterium]|nr:transcriptional regulator [Treponemataceae bacterium]